MDPSLDFRYVDLKDVDPNFTLLDPEYYNLRITKAELRTYNVKADSAAVIAGKATVGEERAFINFAFTVVGHDKFTGRKLFESLFPSEFSFKCLKRIEEATGVQQKSSLEDWLAELTQIQPVIKLNVEKVPDVIKGIPNPKTVRPDGTPGDKNQVAWKSGVAVSDIQ
jgi:hypothetical protein